MDLCSFGEDSWGSRLKGKDLDFCFGLGKFEMPSRYSGENIENMAEYRTLVSRGEG